MAAPLRSSSADSCVVLQQAMAVSEDQIQDLLYLRHLYITKRSVLHAKRQAYLNGTCMGGTEPLHPHADLNHFTDLARVLKDTAMQDCKAYHQLCHAVFKGVGMQSHSYVANRFTIDISFVQPAIASC